MLKIVFLALVLSSLTCGQRDAPDDCTKNADKIRLEDRECGPSCDEDKPCRRSHKCMCDGACGKVCISNGHTCVKPKRLVNGRLTFPPKLSFNSKIQHTCNEGFELIGPVEKFCRGDELWSGKESFCTIEGVRCGIPPFEVQNGFADSLDEQDKKDYYVNETVVYECDIGYRAKFRSISTTKCEYQHSKKTADWNPEITLECEKRLCGRPPFLENGGHKPDGDNFVFGNQIEFYCNPGYRLFGNTILVCGADQTWSGYPPECEPVTCSKPKDIPFGEIFISGLSYKSFLRYSCQDGYFLRGNANRWCSDDGDWDGKTPECKEIDCGEPEKPKKGSVDFIGTKLNAVAKYKCNLGTTSINDDLMTANCIVDNDEPKWSVPTPVCFEDCVRKPGKRILYYGSNRRQAYETRFKHGLELTVKCIFGSEIMPNEQLAHEKDAKKKCNDGSWKPDLTCEAARCFCENLPTAWLEERNFLHSQCQRFLLHEKELTLSCHHDYPQLRKQGHLRCKEGKWEYPEYDENVRCVPRRCSADHLKIENGKVYLITKPQKKEFLATKNIMMPHGSKFEASCNRGYEFNHQFKLLPFECNNGTILKALPTCYPARCKCKELKTKLTVGPVQLDGRVCANEYESHGNEIPLSCIDGYSTSSKLKIECDFGEWGTITGQCEKMCHCNSFLNDVRELSIRIVPSECDKYYNHEEFATLQCASDYSKLQESVEIQCHKGKWLYEDTYCYKKCKCQTFANDVKKKSIRIKDHCAASYEHEKSIDIDCADGYSSIKGPGKTKCVNGKWQIGDTNCYEICNCETFAHDVNERSIRIKDQCTFENHGKTIDIICAKDYSAIERPGQAKCENGRWDAGQTKCHASCTYRENQFHNGYLVIRNGGQPTRVDYGQSIAHGRRDIQFKCFEGFHINSPSSISVNCTDGEWKGRFVCTKDNEPVIEPTTNDNPQKFTTEATTSVQDNTVNDVVNANTTTVVTSDDSNNVTEKFSSRYTTENLSPEVKTLSSIVIATPPSEIIDCDPISGSSTGCHDVLSFNDKTTMPETLIPKGPCKLKRTDVLIAKLQAMKDIKNLEEVDGELLFPHRSEVKFRCKDVVRFKFQGTTVLKCTSGIWNGTLPTCGRLVVRKTSDFPMIDYMVEMGSSDIDDDGTILITEGAQVTLKCLWFENYGNPEWIYDSSDEYAVEPPVWNSYRDSYELLVSKIKSGTPTNFTCVTPFRKANSIFLKMNSPKTTFTPTKEFSPTPVYIPVSEPNGKPSRPTLHVESITRSSINLRWDINETDKPFLTGFTMSSKEDSNDWQHIQLSGHTFSYSLEAPKCLTKYQFYVTAQNKLGVNWSNDINVETKGSVPIKPKQENFLRIHSKSVMLLLNQINDGGCPISNYKLDYIYMNHPNYWYQISVTRPIELTYKNYSVVDLLPDRELTFNFIVTNKAGSTQCYYHFKTLKEITNCPDRKSDDVTTYSYNKLTFASNGGHEHGTKMTIQCQSGYEITPVRGDGIITHESNSRCENGRWNPDLYCIPARCNCHSLPSLLNDKKLSFGNCNKYISSGNDIETFCPEHYAIKHGLKISCQRGSWQIPNEQPECMQESLAGNCLLNLTTASGMKAFSDGQEYSGNVFNFPSGSSLFIRCINIVKQKLKGKSQIRCENGQWQPPSPKCILTSSVHYGEPPVIGLQQYLLYQGSSKIYNDISPNFTDDGRVIIPKHVTIFILCKHNGAHPTLTFEEDGYRKTIPFYRKSDIDGAFLTATSVPHTRVKAKVKCSYYFGYIKQEHGFDLIIGDVCQLNAEFLNNNRLHVLPGERRSLYAEGDTVAVRHFNSPTCSNIECVASSQWEIKGTIRCP